MGAKPQATPRRALSMFCMLFVGAVALAVTLAFGRSSALADEPTIPTTYDEALDRLNRLTAEYDAVAAAQDQTLTKLQDVRTEIKGVESQMGDLQKEVDKKQVDLEAKRELLANQVVSEYKSGGVSLLTILLSSSSFEEAISKAYYFGAVSKMGAEKIDAVNAAKSELEAEQANLKKLESELHEREATIEQLYDEQTAQADAMYQQQLEAAELVNSLPREVQETLGEDVEELVNESQAVINANEMQNEQSSSNTTSGNSSQKTTNNNSSSTKNNNSSSSNNSNKNNSSNSGSSSSAPKTTVGAPGTLQALIDMAYATGPTRRDWGCSGWVYIVFRDAGISSFSGSAAQFYSKWCYSSDRSELRPGMIIAVNNTGGSEAGRMYGHIGIYLGNDIVRHYTGGKVQEFSVDKWIKWYGSVCTPRWGWNGGVVLS